MTILSFQEMELFHILLIPSLIVNHKISGEILSKWGEKNTKSLVLILVKVPFKLIYYNLLGNYFKISMYFNSKPRIALCYPIDPNSSRFIAVISVRISQRSIILNVIACPSSPRNADLVFCQGHT